MKIVEVIESRHWRNKNTGQTASIFGACPWTSAKDAPNWHTVSSGYTWRLDNGTIGLGRKAAKTREEAEQIMLDFNGKFARK